MNDEKAIRDSQRSFLKFYYVSSWLRPLIIFSSSKFTYCTCVSNSLSHLTIQISCLLLHSSTKVAVFFGQLRQNVRRRLPYFLRMDANLFDAKTAFKRQKCSLLFANGHFLQTYSRFNKLSFEIGFYIQKTAHFC